MARNRIGYFAVLLGAVVFHAYYTEWFSWFLLVLLGALPIFSLILSLPAMFSAKLYLEVPLKVQQGSSAAAQLKFTAWGQVGRVYVCLAGKRNQRLYLRRGKVLPLPLPTQHCTVTTLQLCKGRCLDYLGLFAFPLALPKPCTTEIYPQKELPEPPPDITSLCAPALRPLPGGGFSEIHELRSYRPGDAVRDIHWKLSAKTDELLLREAQEEVRPEVLLALSLSGPSAASDSSLGQLLYLSTRLLDENIPHRVLCVRRPGDPISAVISEESQLAALLSQLLHELPAMEPAPALPAQPAGVWYYPIVPRGQEVSQ